MNGRFEGKSVLVTGATSGIGRTTAVAYAKEGASVAITGRRAELGAEVAREIEAAGGQALFIQGDIQDEAHIADMVAKTVGAFGGLHVAVNNAGVEITGMITELEAGDIDRVMGINVRGVLLSMKHEIPAILKTVGERPAPADAGAIVNLSSIAGHIGMPGASIYFASKHAVLGATKVAAMELAQQGIRVNAVSPGGIETDMLDRFSGGNADQMAGMHPMGRIGTTQEIADAILWVSSAQASFVTGQSILVDGGFTTP